MKIKEAILSYYHLIYRTLKIGDKELHKGAEGDLVDIINEDLVRLDALLSLLLYIDDKIPAIRCQRALSKFKKDLEGLYYLFREKNFLSHKKYKALQDDYNEIISEEINAQSQRFIKSTHDLYLNSIHSTEKAISNHLSQLQEDKIQIGILAYFTHVFDELKSRKIDVEYEEVGYLSRGLLANLGFLSYIEEHAENANYQKIYKIVSQLVTDIKQIHLCDITLKAIEIGSQPDSSLTNEVKKEISALFSDLVKHFDELVKAESLVLAYVRNIVEREQLIRSDDVRQSISARNLLYSMS